MFANFHGVLLKREPYGNLSYISINLRSKNLFWGKYKTYDEL